MEDISNDIWNVAKTVAAKSNCKKRKVGTVILDGEGLIVSIGWNRYEGESCEDSDGNTKPGVEHSEDMAYQNLTEEDKNKTLYAYVTHQPCSYCEHILNSVCEKIFVKELSPKWDEDDFTISDTTTVENLLEDRGKQYGSFDTFISNMQHIMNTLEAHRGSETELDKETIENFFIVLKQLRMQTETDLDSLDDLQGYAKLIKERRLNENNS